MVLGTRNGLDKLQMRRKRSVWWKTACIYSIQIQTDALRLMTAGAGSSGA